MVRIIESAEPVRYRARDGQLWSSRADVARYHGELDVWKAIGDALHNGRGGNRLVHGFVRQATEDDVAAVARLAAGPSRSAPSRRVSRRS